jgi:excinuclease ABC subunit C
MAKKVSKALERVGDSIADHGLYPHLKITGEKYPRLLATRKILDKKDEYFGAFLPVTSVRVWLYHLNKIFGLRSCDLPLDGNFPQPCALYFTKKCLAPCVAALCARDEYMEHVEALRLFLSDDQRGYEDLIVGKIEAYAENLEFEKAAHWRDIWERSRMLAANKRFDIRLGRTVDTYSILETADSLVVYLVTSRGRRLIGNKEFIFDKSAENTAENVIEKILNGFYQFHAPREIRLPFPYKYSSTLRRGFFERFGKDVRITVHADELNDIAEGRLKRTQVDFALEKIGDDVAPGHIAGELKRIFGLRKKPKRIEAFDVAHISNLDFVAASCVWEDGEIYPDRMRFRVVEAGGEPQAMALGVLDRLLIPPAPDLIVVDGGKGQLNAVLEALKNAGVTELPVVSAAKPPGKHRDISYFLNSNGERTDFIPGDRAHELLRELRDEAHQNANELHRQHRENKYIFEDVGITMLLSEAERKALLKKFGSIKAIGEASVDDLAAEIGAEKAGKILQAAGSPPALPLVITRLNELGGGAGDLRPINARLEN